MIVCSTTKIADSVLGAGVLIWDLRSRIPSAGCTAEEVFEPMNQRFLKLETNQAYATTNEIFITRHVSPALIAAVTAQSTVPEM